MEYKISCPCNFSSINPVDDNFDVNVVMKDGNVYFATLLTPANSSRLMESNAWPGFWVEHMIICRDLSPKSIRGVFDLLFARRQFQKAVYLIGSIEEVFGEGTSYDDVVSIG